MQLKSCLKSTASFCKALGTKLLSFLEFDQLFKEPVEKATDPNHKPTLKQCFSLLIIFILSSGVLFLYNRKLDVPFPICIILASQFFALTIQQWALLGILQANNTQGNGSGWIFLLAIVFYYPTCILCYPTLFFDIKHSKKRLVSSDYINTWRSIILVTEILFIMGGLLAIMNLSPLLTNMGDSLIYWCTILALLVAFWYFLNYLSDSIFNYFEHKINQANTENHMINSFNAKDASQVCRIAWIIVTILFYLFLSFSVQDITENRDVDYIARMEASNTDSYEQYAKSRESNAEKNTDASNESIDSDSSKRNDKSKEPEEEDYVAYIDRDCESDYIARISTTNDEISVIAKFKDLIGCLAWLIVLKDEANKLKKEDAHGSSSASN